MIRDKARKIGDDYNLIRAFPQMPGRLFTVAFSHDGNRIAAGSSYNGTGEVRVYNYADATVVSRFEVPGGGIYSVDFSHDNKTIAAAGFDGQVYLVNVETGELIKAFTPVTVTATVATTANEQ
jgi:WD40 repeat protein